MRLVTWNCKMAFRNKAADVLNFSPDIIIISECENPANLAKRPNCVLSECLWFGSNPNKGIAIFGLNGYKISLREEYNEENKWIVPIRVEGKHSFTLFAVWACNCPSDRKLSYIGQVYRAFNVDYGKILEEDNVIIAGDFNSNKIWDNWQRIGNHSDVVKMFDEYGIKSTYHEFMREEQGKESLPTLYLWHNETKSFHIDYCFASNSWMNKLGSVVVGDYESWHKLSDHCPMVVDFINS